MEKFVADYKIPNNVGLRYCKEGDWHIVRREGEVVIPIIAFLEGGMRLPMRPVVRDYLRHFRLAPIRCIVNMFRILGSVDALNEQMGLRLTQHDVNWCSSTRSYLSIRSISWRMLVAGFPVRDFLKPCLAGRLLLKVLMATSSKLPSISLYISQYLPK